MNIMSDVSQSPLFQYTLRLADDSVVLGQRLAEWCAGGPFLEEDIALSNVALDYIGRANLFYEYAAQLDHQERNADQLCFLRDSREYTNLLIYELPRGDFACTITRQFLVDVCALDYLAALSSSQDATLAAIAGKTVKESRYHLRRHHQWLIQLGDGTDESHRRMQAALEELWPYTHEMFVMDELESDLHKAGIAVDRATLAPRWKNTVEAALNEATLKMPAEENVWRADGGRNGIHTEHLGLLLAEMQSMQRTSPGLQW